MNYLYHIPFDVSSRFARILLEEYGISYKLREENISEKSPELLAKNPAGEVPVLDISGQYAVCSAIGIAEFLHSVYGKERDGANFLGGDHFQQAEIRRLIQWYLQKATCEVTDPLIRERLYFSVQPSTERLRIARHNMNHHLQYSEYLISQRGGIATEKISLADFAAGALITVLDYLEEVHWEKFPILRNWYAGLKSRPAIQTVLKDRIPGLQPPAYYANPDF